MSNYKNKQQHQRSQKQSNMGYPKPYHRLAPRKTPGQGWFMKVVTQIGKWLISGINAIMNWLSQLTGNSVHALNRAPRTVNSNKQDSPGNGLVNQGSIIMKYEDNIEVLYIKRVIVDGFSPETICGVEENDLIKLYIEKMEGKQGIVTRFKAPDWKNSLAITVPHVASISKLIFKPINPHVMICGDDIPQAFTNNNDLKTKQILMITKTTDGKTIGIKTEYFRTISSTKDKIESKILIFFLTRANCIIASGSLVMCGKVFYVVSSGLDAETVTLYIAIRITPFQTPVKIKYE